MITILLFLIVILIPLREGYQQRDRVEPSKYTSNIWHGLGLIMRLILILFIYITTKNLIYTTATLFMLTVVYSIACAIGSKQKWYYLSNRGIDKILRRLLFWIDFN